jgi:dienelactone hydrolase
MQGQSRDGGLAAARSADAMQTWCISAAKARSTFLRLAHIALLAVGIAGCGNNAAQSIRIPVEAVDGSRTPDRPLTATLTLPKGPGPYAAVILLHGCDGVGTAQASWVPRLQEWNYASLIVDSFTARGFSNVCLQQRVVTPEDRVPDVLSAARFLQSLPMIDGARIAVLGQSHGGTVAALVTSRRYYLLHPGLLKASIDYYGACGWQAEGFGAVPLLVLAGESDDYGSPAMACHLFAEKLKPDQPFEMHTYPGVWHAFDNPNARGMSNGHITQFDYQAAHDSYERVRVFLDKWIRRTPSS